MRPAGQAAARGMLARSLLTRARTCGSPGIGIEDAFAEVARDYSQCPSARDGGSLGVFKPGQMVAEFDRCEMQMLA